jgi:hypothetical protein
VPPCWAALPALPGTPPAHIHIHNLVIVTVCARPSGRITISVLDPDAKVRGSLQCCESGSALILGGCIRIQEGKKFPT